jgi:DNA-binding MarR family transcriptional regulator
MYLVKMGNPYYDTFATLRQTNMLLDKLLNRRYQRFGLTYTSMEVLYAVAQGPKPISAYLLARILGREHHSVVELVNRLKRKGLIRRTTVNGRPSLEITDSGREVVSKVAAMPQLMETVFGSVPSEQLEQLQNALLPVRQAAMRGLGLVDMGEMKIPAPVNPWP